MSKTLILVSTALLSLSVPASAKTDGAPSRNPASACPVKATGGDLVERIAAAIGKSKTCDQAAKIAESCAFGDSKDLHIAAPADEFCRKTIKDLKPEDKTMWEALSQKCSDKYDTHQGTMYRSFAAFCRLNVTKLFAELYEPIEE